MSKRPELQIFLCHWSGDKQRVRQLYDRLKADGYKPWIDDEDILPGQDWDVAIRKAVRESQIVIVCLSANSITKDGYVQKEIRLVLDHADEKPENTIFLVPARLEACEVPDRLRRWHWVDLFQPRGYQRLKSTLSQRQIQVSALNVDYYMQSDALLPSEGYQQNDRNPPRTEHSQETEPLREKDRAHKSTSQAEGVAIQRRAAAARTWLFSLSRWALAVILLMGVTLIMIGRWRIPTLVKLSGDVASPKQIATRLARVPVIVKVLDTSGRPLLMAAVLIERSGEVTCPAQFTDTSGTIRCALTPGGDYRVVAHYHMMSFSDTLAVTADEVPMRKTVIVARP